MTDACPLCGSTGQPRTSASHRAYFAQLHELYLTMPEDVTDRLPTFDQFRKFCLIRTGWRNETTYICDTKKEAQAWARRLRALDDFSIVQAGGTCLVRWTAKSQCLKAMGKADFQKSKDDVLAYAQGLLERKAA